MAGAPGADVFTLTGKDAGAVCTFRIAYARSWEFTSFADYEEANGDLIEVPVMVIDSGACNPYSDSACLGDFPSSDSGAMTLAASATLAAVTLLTI